MDLIAFSVIVMSKSIAAHICSRYWDGGGAFVPQNKSTETQFPSPLYSR